MTIIGLSVLAGTYGIADDGTAVQKAIFLRIRKAAEAPTFEGAGVILDSIKTQDITDPDLASLFAITKEFTEFCSDVGIPRDAKVSYIEILARIDRAAILSKLIERGGENAPAEAARLIAKASRLKDQIPLYEQLDRKLAERYGLAPPPRKVDLTVAACAGQYTWRTDGRTIDFDLKLDGTFTAYNKPDNPQLKDLVRDGKGTWEIRDGFLTVKMTHVWVGFFWKELPVTWIEREAIQSATDRRIELKGSTPLIRK